MSQCYDTFLLNRHEEREAAAEARDEAFDAVVARIHAELVADFKTGLSGRPVTMRQIATNRHGVDIEGFLPFPLALHDTLDGAAVMGLFLCFLEHRTGEAFERFADAAAHRYADLNSEFLAELESRATVKDSLTHRSGPGGTMPCTR